MLGRGKGLQDRKKGWAKPCYFISKHLSIWIQEKNWTWTAYLFHMQWMRLFRPKQLCQGQKINWENNSFSYELVSWPLQHFCTAGPDDNSAKSSSENQESLGLNPPVNQWIWFFCTKVNMMQVYIKFTMPWIKNQSQTPRISILVSFSTLYF